MTNGFLRAFLATAILSLCLGVLRLALPYGDWALLLLLPLAWLLFTGQRQLEQQIHQSRQRVVWREMSWPMRLFTGRIGATVWAGVFTIVSVPILAWQAVSLPPDRLPQVGGAFLLAALLFAILTRYFGRHLQEPFHRCAAIATATWIIAVPFALLAAWQTFKLDVIPAELLNASFSQLPATAIKTLPFRDSILSTIMWPLHFLGCLKQWIAGHHPQYRWLAMLISIDAGLYGFLMARTAAVMTDRLHLPVNARPRSPSRWFWGTIIMLTVMTLTLQWVGMERVKRALDDFQALPEASAENFEVVLDKAATQAADAVTDQIDVQVDAAFAPVYDRIPDYAGFHYSVAGEYLELATFAVGSLENAMNERLFEGLPERLDKVAFDIDAAFADEYEQQVHEQVNAASSQVDWGQTVDVLTKDIRERMMVTAPAMAVTATVGASGGKLIAKTVAKKASSKLAAKVAAKGAVKSGSVLTGMGAGATVCSFAGPAAVVCGAGGALVAWIAVDAAVINIDELLNRDEFEADLRGMVDTERQRVKDTLRQALAQRAGELQRVAPQQARDMTLDQLSRPERQDVCSRAQQLMSGYAVVQTQLAAREPTSLAAFTADLDATEGDHTLAPMVQAMRSAIVDQGSRVQVESVAVKGNFRHDDRVDRNVTAQLQLQGTAVDLHGRASVDYGFYLQTTPDLTLDLTRDIVARVAVEQHLRIRSNRLFGGEVQIRELLSDLGHAQGLSATWTAPVQIMRDPDADGLADMGVSPGPTAPITLTLRLAGVPLPDVLPLTSCAVPETVTLTQEAVGAGPSLP